jgi:2-iminoacetate synthase
MEEGEYRKLVEAGCDGVTLYQETYDRSLYSEFHPYGPKASYSNRLAFQENSAKAGMRRLGLGALLGLHDWRYETMAMAIHGRYLMQKYWQSRLAFSFPRMRPAAEVDRDKFKFVSDTELVQMLVSLRLCFPDAALVISTREPEYMRNNLIHLGITQISAGSKTNPGGYSEEEDSTSQFDISDSRSADEIAAYLDKHGYEPVWKDWDSSFGCV